MVIRSAKGGWVRGHVLGVDAGVVAEMLAALEAEPGMRVLEVGTGTGYNAALLAHRLGIGNVVSVEVDPVVAEHARQALAAAGFSGVTVVTGDGAEGYFAACTL
jgi:protein-L-isoaspartate O-methyltransferase